MAEEHESETELLDAVGSVVTTTLRLYGVGAAGSAGALGGNRRGCEGLRQLSGQLQ